MAEDVLGETGGWGSARWAEGKKWSSMSRHDELASSQSRRRALIEIPIVGFIKEHGDIDIAPLVRGSFDVRAEQVRSAHGGATGQGADGLGGAVVDQGSEGWFSHAAVNLSLTVYPLSHSDPQPSRPPPDPVHQPRVEGC